MGRNRWVAVGLPVIALAACGGGDAKPISIASAAPSAPPAQASGASAGGPCLHTSGRVEATDLPRLAEPSADRLERIVLEVGPDDYPNCKVAQIHVSVAATADDLGALGQHWSLVLFRHGPAAVASRTAGRAALIHEGRFMRGSQLGSSCGALVFEPGKPEFLPGREPPYDGTYGPRGGGFAAYIDKPAAGTYTLYPTDIQAPLTITCFVIDFEFQPD